MYKKILFVDTVHPILEERLIKLGYSCEHDLTAPKKQIEEKIANYFGLVIRSRFSIDSFFLDKAINLKFIARSGAGLENINIAYAEKKDIKVFNSPEGNMDAVGEQAIGMLLMLFNQLKKADAEVRNGIWDRQGNRGLEISGKTVAIIGYGNMGSAFAKKLSGFDCKVIAFDKYKVNYSSKIIEELKLEDIYKAADIVSIHLPLSEETHHYVDAAFLANFQKPIYVINTARGNNVCTADIVSALKSAKVLGACLDVLEYETTSFETINSNKLPVDFQYLVQSDKVILSPHIAGWTKESYVKLSSFLADKIELSFSVKLVI
ncbi:MAG: NAD(P)-binding domain-containing protein [Xanthomonadales bacterium]|nr:NAD(P)-binding domain-containing protein [Xanthomonadales bacterium]